MPRQAGSALFLNVAKLLLLGAAMWQAALGAACQTAAEPDVSATDLGDAFRAVREEMVQKYINGQGIEDPRVLDAMRAVHREEFVLYRDRFKAYSDAPLPIKEGQTISQPFIVGHMTEILELEPGDSVLEVGTGSGYQTAVLAEITDEVYSIEIIPLLAREAEDRLARLGYEKVQLKQDDGYFGWEEYAPFDAIIVTAAPDHVPHPLLRQLRDGGNMVIPVGPPGAVQTLWHIRLEGDEFKRVNKGLVVFVPLLR